MKKKRTNFSKRAGDDFPILTRSEIEQLCKDARQGLGSGNPGGYIREPNNAIRDAALVSWEYLPGKRISEFTGRDYYEDHYGGLTIEHLRFTQRTEGPFLQFYIRILKRDKRKKICPRCKAKNPAGNDYCKKCGCNVDGADLDSHLKEVWKWKEIDLSDALAKYITDWLDVLKPGWQDPNVVKGDGRRVFDISRMQAWRIMNNLGIINHVNRHWKATHESDTKNAFELQETLDRATPPTEYVHNNPHTQLEKSREAAKKWA